MSSKTSQNAELARFLALVSDDLCSYNPELPNHGIYGAEMTIDKSLKIKAGGVKQRNVLTRPERLAKLAAADRWKEGDSVLGIPKVRVQKITMKKKKKAKKTEEEETKTEAAE